MGGRTMSEANYLADMQCRFVSSCSGCKMPIG
jgi:hypothetical protein